jgi:hypothetical protein
MRHKDDDELDGVIYQVPEHLLEPGGVGVGAVLPGGQVEREVMILAEGITVG